MESHESKKFYRIAVGLDGSDSSWKAFEEAMRQASYREVDLYVISIHESLDASYNASEVLAAERTVREKLELVQIRARMQAEEAKLKVITTIGVGNSVTAMVDYVKKNAVNLLILGDTGHSSIWGALLGTTVDRVVRNAPCSVLVVR